MTVETREMTKLLESNQPVLCCSFWLTLALAQNTAQRGRTWRRAYLEFTGNFWCQLQ